MTVDLAALKAALAKNGAVVRIVVAEARGSAPRGAGTSMLVWKGGLAGTIGGGALEWRALEVARAVLHDGRPRVERMPLGPALGQCCGGAVTLVLERLDAMPNMPWLRRVEGAANAPPAVSFGLRSGWMYEQAETTERDVWIWGAGHVGRAIASVLAPLPEIAVTCIDTPARMPELPSGATPLVAADMPRAFAHAPVAAEHLIVTYSHEIDLALCHAALRRGFGFCGLIGSQTKWARFRSRLSALGHKTDEIARITCPIGDPRLGKHPQAIAVGVVAGLISRQPSEEMVEGTSA